MGEERGSDSSFLFCTAQKEKPWESTMFLAGKKGFKVFGVEVFQQGSKFSVKSRHLPQIYRRSGLYSSISPTLVLPSFPGQDLRDLQLSNSPKEMPRTECTQIEPDACPWVVLPGGCPLGQGADDPAQCCMALLPPSLWSWAPHLQR